VVREPERERGREGGREGGRERERKTHTHTHTHTEREREREETGKERKTGKERETGREGETERQRDLKQATITPLRRIDTRAQTRHMNMKGNGNTHARKHTQQDRACKRLTPPLHQFTLLATPHLLHPNNSTPTPHTRRPLLHEFTLLTRVLTCCCRALCAHGVDAIEQTWEGGFRG